MNGKLYFTRKGADRLRQEKDKLVARLKETQSQKGEAAEIGGNVWHDNFAFEDLCRQEMMLSNQIEKVSQDLARMVVIENAPPDCTKVRIGHLIHLLVGETPMKVIVGGHGDSEPNVDPPVVSYTAPLIKGLIGKAQGANATANLGGEMKRITIQKIELPPKGG